MSALRGQGEEFERTLRAARSLRMHHGLLISGGMGVGKSTAAELLAQALMCRDPDPERPCGVCSDCRRLALHPDIHRVEIPDEKDEIPVDLVRELRESLARLPVEGRARVVILDPADRLNIQGQNALLKTLEEPGRATFLLLVTRYPESLLDTVRSRVGSLRILPLPDAALRSVLRERGVADEAVEAALPFAEGSVGRARAWSSEENIPIIHLLSGYLAGGAGSAVAVARAALDGASSRVAAVERVRTGLWILRALLRRELWRTLAGSDPGTYVPRTSVRWTSVIESLLDAEIGLHQRIPPEQVLVRALLSVRSPSTHQM